MFFEVLNAAGVHQVPMVISIWDDNYGISVENKDQTIKEDISEALKGFRRTDGKEGFEIFKVKGWNYPDLINVYQKANDIAREKHIPVIIHVNELTQPIGHSTSGSHERYKSDERLEWEKDHDCNLRMKQWIIENQIATLDELEKIEQDSVIEVKNAKNEAWNTYLQPILSKKNSLLDLLRKVNLSSKADIESTILSLERIKEPNNKDLLTCSRSVLRKLIGFKSVDIDSLKNWVKKVKETTQYEYSSHLYNQYNTNENNVEEIAPYFDNDSKLLDGRIVLRNNFEKLFEKYDNLLIFGEDTGKIGDVNQGLEGLQEKFGEDRVGDRGIREASIVGEGIGLALRGFRPIAEIQYLDYIFYALQILSDDLATLHYRTRGKQISPLIVRTRGHRLEGIWHSGSPMGALLSTLRGVNILVPRNMVQAAGMYNTLLKCQEPAILIESLNGYRLKEKEPSNLAEFTVKLGKSEILRHGKDLTVVSYGSTIRLVEKAAFELEKNNIDIEIIDIQTLIPFDKEKTIRRSLEKTNKILIVDEDIPGGASAYILHKLIDDQNAYELLDSKPITLTAKHHRPPYGTDGDYFSKPSMDDIIETILSIMNEYNPKLYPNI